MFSTKRKQLFAVTPTQSVASNAFVNAGMKKGAETLSKNGALKYSSN